MCLGPQVIAISCRHQHEPWNQGQMVSQNYEDTIRVADKRVVSIFDSTSFDLYQRLKWIFPKFPSHLFAYCRCSSQPHFVPWHHPTKLLGTGEVSKDDSWYCISPPPYMYCSCHHRIWLWYCQTSQAHGFVAFVEIDKAVPVINSGAPAASPTPESVGDRQGEKYNSWCCTLFYIHENRPHNMSTHTNYLCEGISKLHLLKGPERLEYRP